MLWALLALQFPTVKVAELRELSLQYQSFKGGNRFPELGGRPAKDAIELNMAIDVLKVGDLSLYWDNTVHGMQDPGQFRLVGWKFDLGIRYRWLEAGIEHHSQHILDAEQGIYGFPVNDSYYVKIYLVR